MIKNKPLISKLVWLFFFPLLLSCTGQNDRLESKGDQEELGSQITEGQPVLTFDKVSHDFGTIIEGEKVVCYFDYENTGKEALILSAVEVTCGCTTPDWSSEPLEPGERKSLQVIFDASGRSGVQLKTLTVISNASNQVVKIMLIANIETSV